MVVVSKRKFLFVLLFVYSLVVYADESVTPWSGSFGFGYSDNRTNYVSRQFVVDADTTYKQHANEVVLEASLNRQYLEIPGAGNSLANFQYDSNAKWKHYYEESLYYAYISPRFRHNNSGYFTSAQALRIGLGKKFLFDEERFEMTLELGGGYRVATLAGPQRIEEQLLTVLNKFNWKVSDTLAFKLNLVREQSQRERYQTSVIELKNKLSDHFGMKYQITQKRAYPFSSTQKGGEMQTAIGFDYEL